MSVEISADGDTLVIVKDEPTRHVFRLTGDPRVFDDIIWFDVSLWDEPAGEPMSAPDRHLVLDALQAWCADAPNIVIARHDTGFDVLLRARPGVRLVGTHATGYDTGYVTLLEVARFEKKIQATLARVWGEEAPTSANPQAEVRAEAMA